MTGLVAGIAAKEVASGFGSGFLALLKRSWKQIVVAVAVAIIASIVISHFANDRHREKQLTGLQDWQNMVLGSVRAEVPPERRAKVDASEIAAEIQWLGRERRTLQVTLDDQSTKLRIAQGKADAAQKGVKDALEAASQRERADQATRTHLRDPKRSTGLTEAEWGKL